MLNMPLLATSGRNLCFVRGKYEKFIMVRAINLITSLLVKGNHSFAKDKNRIFISNNTFEPPKFRFWNVSTLWSRQPQKTNFTKDQAHKDNKSRNLNFRNKHGCSSQMSRHIQWHYWFLLEDQNEGD